MDAVHSYLMQKIQSGYFYALRLTIKKILCYDDKYTEIMWRIWVKNKKISIVLLIFVLLTAIVIFAFSAQTKEESKNISQNLTKIFLNFFSLTDVNVNQAEHILRKCAHVAEFALLSAALCTAALYMPKLKNSVCLCAVAAFGFSLLYAVTDEIHQKFVPGRGPSVRDVLLDALGALIGIFIVITIRFFVICIRKNKTEKSS